jgi:ribosomal protein S1
VGAPIGVVVLENDAAGRRIRLSVKAIAEAEEAAEVRDYAKRSGADQNVSLGSLADKLRGAIGSKAK